MSELASAVMRRLSDRTGAYQRRLGPSKGGIGSRLSWNEKSTRTTTGRKMKP